MSLDVYIKYKKPKMVTYKAGFNTAGCGSNVAVYPSETVRLEEYWSANITHNMGKMADYIPVTYKIEGEEYSNTLYDLVWKPDDWGCANTIIIAQALQSGISYMVAHREELLQYNPSNGWGDYNSFLLWLIEYWQACLENPDCEIEISR